MAQWKTLKDLVKSEKINGNRINMIYGPRTHFSVSFREKYAIWIESQEWPSDCEPSAAQDEAERKFLELKALMYNDMNAIPFPDNLVFQGQVEAFIEHYDGRYDLFAMMMANVIKSEQTLLQSALESPKYDDDRHVSCAQDNPKVVEAISLLRNKLRGTSILLKHFEETQERDKLNLLELQEKKAKVQVSSPQAQEELNKLDKNYNDCVTHLHEARQKTSCSVSEAADDLKRLLPLVWDDLATWKEDQRLACTMLRKPKDHIMEVLDRMCEAVADVFMQMLQQIDKLVELLQIIVFKDDTILQAAKAVHEDLWEKLQTHLQKVFVSDKNIPKQVLKVTNGRSLSFSLSVRLLGGYAFGLNVNQPKVSARLYPEKQLNDVMSQPQPTIKGCCTIQNAENKTFEFLRSGNCMANFNNMVVLNVKREGKGQNNDFVTDYKSAFVFFTSIRIFNKDIPLKVMSLPLVITSQTSQECMARGTVIWCSAFPRSQEEIKKEKLPPFEPQEEVPWVKVSEVINALFKEYTDRHLTPEHIGYLAKIAFRENKDLEFNKLNISRQAVLKDKLEKREFSFWKWLIACLNSVKDTLKSEWREGLLYGFISKQDAEQKLLKEKTGTFLIRFSESNIETGQRADIHGYLTVAVNEIHPHDGQATVFHVKESLTPKDVLDKKLAPVLEAYETDDFSKPSDTKATKKLLNWLWTPTKLHPFDEVFGKYIKQKEQMNDGYRRGRYLIKITLSDAVVPNRQNSSQWPMSPGSLPTPSPASSDMFSNIGSPDSSFSGSMDANSSLSSQIPVCAVPPYGNGYAPQQVLNDVNMVQQSFSNSVSPNDYTLEADNSFLTEFINSIAIGHEQYPSDLVAPNADGDMMIVENGGLLSQLQQQQQQQQQPQQQSNYQQQLSATQM